MHLRSPRFGNTETYDSGVVDVRSADGTLLQNNRGFEMRQFSVTVDSLSYASKEALLSFLENVIGEQVTMRDHEGFDWTGFITDQNPKIVTEGRGCNYSLSFNFEGVKS